MRSLQATYLKYVEYADILSMHNSRLIEQWVIMIRISAVCISLLCCNIMSKLLPSVDRDTGNILVVQYTSSCYTFRIIQPFTPVHIIRIYRHSLHVNASFADVLRHSYLFIGKNLCIF